MEEDLQKGSLNRDPGYIFLYWDNYDLQDNDRDV